MTEHEVPLDASTNVSAEPPAIELTNLEICGWLQSGELTEIHFVLDSITEPRTKYVLRIRNQRSAKAVLEQLKAAVTQVWPKKYKKKADNVPPG